VTPQHVGRRIACKKCGAALVVEADGIQLVEAAREPDPPQTVSERVASPTSSGSKPELAPSQSEVTEIQPALPRAPARGNAFVDFLLFRRMLTPILIQVVFWIGVGYFALTGGATLVGTLLLRGIDLWTIVLAVLAALAQLILGPLLLRVGCEAILVLFRIHETLREIRDKENP
jgi:hypothetical protein